MGARLKYITDIHNQTPELIGNKAYYLSKAHEYGYKIPDSLCLNTQAYIDFLKLHYSREG